MNVYSEFPCSLPAVHLEDSMGELYDTIYSFDNLYAAYRLARLGKGTRGEAINFGLNLSNNLWTLHDQLKARTYDPGGYYHFTITEPKRREVHALRFSGRVVQHSICDNVLRPWMEPRLIYDCAACRIGKGSHFAMDRLSGFFREFYKQYGTEGYVLKCDIRKYFDNIDHEILRYRMRKFPDKEVLDLMFRFLDAYHGDTGKGIPLGNQSSQWFALYYLDPMDRLIKERLRIKWYTRYMDGFLLIHPDKAYLQHCLDEIRKLCTELKLELNEKTHIFPLSQGVDYLGFHFYLTDTGKVVRRLRSSNKRRYKRKLKAFRHLYAKGGIELDAIDRSLASLWGHLGHGHTWKMQKRTLSHFVLTRSSEVHEQSRKGENNDVQERK